MSQPASFFADTIIKQKYSHIKPNGDKESWVEIADRVATSVTKPYLPEITDKIREDVEKKEFIPGGRYLYAAGKKFPAINNCFLLDVEDCRESWADLAWKVTNGLMVGGGIGVVYSKLRGEGASISGLGGTSTGPIALMQMVNEIGRNVMQGGSRRCLPEDSYVHTRRGLIKIKDVLIGDEVITTDGYHNVLNNFDQGEQETVIIKTQNGELECTPNHRVAVIVNPYGEYIWKRAEELVEGDRLYFLNEVIPGIKTKLPKNSFIASKQAYTLKRITIPKLDTGIAWLLGLIHGDGYVHLKNDNSSGSKRHGRITISCSDDYPKILDKAVKQLSRFGVVASIRPSDGLCKSVVVHSVELASYFSQFKKPGIPIIVPDFITTGTVKVRTAYIAGLMDADGSNKTRPLAIMCSIYPEYAKQVQNICSSIGVATRLKLIRNKIGNWKSLYQLSISGEKNHNRFVKLAKKYGHKLSYVNRKATQYSYSLPRKLTKSLPTCSQNIAANISIEKIEEYTGPLKFTPVMVKEVVAGRKVATRDLEVETAHEFIVNGFVQHNSAIWSGLHWNHPDVAKYARIKDWIPEVRALKEKDFNYPGTMDMTNISIILDDAFFEAMNNKENPQHKLADEIYWMVVRRMCKTGEPGFSIDVGENAGEHLRNACVPGYVEILTDKGYQQIDTLVDTEVNVWNGLEWSKVTVKVTGTNSPILSVCIREDDGPDLKDITCTHYHKFILHNGNRISAKDLKPGDKLITSTYPDGTCADFVVEAVTDIGEICPKVYCFNEPKNHSGCFNGVITGQCTEVTSRDDGDVCNLASINLARIQSFDQFCEIVHRGIGFLLTGTMYAKLPYEAMYKVREKNRRLGLGLMGVHEWLLVRGKKYGPDDEFGKWMQAYKDVSNEASKYWANKLGVNVPIKNRAIAPNGTISIAAETTGSAEPIFAVAIKRRYLKNKDWHFQYIIDGAAQRIIERGVDPDLIEDAYDLAEDVERRIGFQAWMQQYVDHGISSTINMSRWGSSVNNEDTVKSFGKILLPYLPKLRGMTTYPDGARGGQPLTKIKYQTAIKHLGKEFSESGIGMEELTNENVCANGGCGV